MTPRKDAAPPAANPPIPESLRTWVLGVVGSNHCEPMGADRYLLRIPIDDLATSLGYAPRSGSLSRRLRRLEDLGIVVSRRPVVFDVTSLHTITDPTGPEVSPGVTSRVMPAQSSPAVPTDRESESPLSRLTDLAHLAFTHGDREVCLAALRTARSLLSTPGPTFDRDTGPASEQTPILRADEDSTPRILTSARNPRAAAFTKKTSSSTSSTGTSTTGVPRPPVQRGRPRPAPVSAADRIRVDTLIEPLVDMCRQRGLPGVSSSAGVHAALASLTDQEIRFGVSAVCELLSAGNQLRSPVGLLVALARRGELHAASAFIPPSPDPVEGPSGILRPPPTPCAQPASWQPARASSAPSSPLPRGADDWLRVVHDLMREESAQPNTTTPPHDLPGVS